jgi:hypothetical protein
MGALRLEMLALIAGELASCVDWTVLCVSSGAAICFSDRSQNTTASITTIATKRIITNRVFIVTLVSFERVPDSKTASVAGNRSEIQRCAKCGLYNHYLMGLEAIRPEDLPVVDCRSFEKFHTHPAARRARSCGIE